MAELRGLVPLFCSLLVGKPRPSDTTFSSPRIYRKINSGRVGMPANATDSKSHPLASSSTKNRQEGFLLFTILNFIYLVSLQVWKHVSVSFRSRYFSWIEAKNKIWREEYDWTVCSSEHLTFHDAINYSEFFGRTFDSCCFEWIPFLYSLWEFVFKIDYCDGNELNM